MSEIGIPKAHIFATSLGTQVAVVMQTLAPGVKESSFVIFLVLHLSRKGL